MHTSPVRHGIDATVADLHEFFTDAHVHAALIVDGAQLKSVVERGDLVHARDDAAAVGLGTLAGRTIAPTSGLDAALARMTATGRRRLAVVDEDQAVVGLLCLKRSRSSFCSDDDVAARRAELR